MTDERTQLRQRAEMAEADAAALRRALDVITRAGDLSSAKALATGMLRRVDGGAAILAVAEAARAFLRADPAVENLADRLIALRAAVEEWER